MRPSGSVAAKGEEVAEVLGRTFTKTKADVPEGKRADVARGRAIRPLALGLSRLFVPRRLHDLLLDDDQAAGKCSGAQQHGGGVGVLDREAARPTFASVTWAKRRVPLALNRNVTIGSLVLWSKPGDASTISSPHSATVFTSRSGSLVLSQ
jgi:hypothetical protein